MTPLEMHDGKPLRWANTAADQPTQISIAPATFTYSGDVAPTISAIMSQEEFNLMAAAAHVWETIANVKFSFISDVPDESSAANIRAGLTKFGSGSIIGQTVLHFNNNNTMLPDTVVTVEDPAERPITPLPDGDLAYAGSTATMFQSFVHEMGHALGLDHNPDDPNSIMSPRSTRNNPLPDQQDIAAIQSLYGAPTQPLQISPSDATLLDSLLKGIGT